MLRDLVIKNRSYRRFYEDFPIEYNTLADLVDLARLSASGKNAQPLKYFISNTGESNSKIFPNLAWAAYLKDWDGPGEGERPSAYIIILLDTTISSIHFCDEGIAAQSIMLGAIEAGLGGCMIVSVKKETLKKALNIPGHLEILMVLALGKPKEIVKIEQLAVNGDYKYWRDAGKVHHVPKRNLEDIIINKR